MSNIERGVIIAGGDGTRLASITGGVNKHIAYVYGRPMIEYPLETLRDMGITDATVVSSKRGLGDIAKFIGDGNQFNLDVTYRVQREASGMAGALGAAAVKEDVFVVLCGDTYHAPAPKLDGGVQLWWTRQEAGNHGAVWVPEINRIVEKPPAALSRLAIIGARVYDQMAIDLIQTLRPSARGELELVDIDNHYLANDLEMTYYQGFFGDMGTPEGLHRVSEYIREN